jgi:hypothetical protein
MSCGVNREEEREGGVIGRCCTMALINRRLSAINLRVSLEESRMAWQNLVKRK